MDRVPAKLVYSDTDNGWKLKTYAQFRVTSNANASMAVTIPPTVSLSVSGKTGTAAVTGRCKLGSYATSKGDGNSCSSGVVIGSDSVLYVSVFPESVSLNQDSSGAYVGSLTITVVYQ